ncbi:asparagine synthase (glutamine-hydrolyzing) [Actinomycetospora chiangmaiensis]|uniref:asparagine synthase (glutamine-hydrolyzing) n=1 Tax=Actinomycetospora chiangmaiensis TaxID=402650 RepID=UPI00039F7BB7|nr:asparagine synthase (glutamine-hydrolyzing) [Actinomycetospora chiangmaiensis]
MCGIVAAYGDIDPEKCERMLARIHHRGPDDSGRVQLESAWLGHQRLSIMDVTGGKQPIADETDSAYVVGNGEIYNHADIRDQLSEVRFATDSDTESAFRLVLRDGSAALHDLRGMFALAMAHTDGHGVVARDPIGIKPLYWAKLPGVTLFASELRAFDEADQPMVEAFPPGYVWSPGLPESGDVAGGTMVRFADAVPVQVRPARYAPDKQWDDSVLEHIRSVLSDSVRRHMMSDVPVGVFLSGGLDSAIVAAVAAQFAAEKGEKLPTFAVGTESSADLLAARAVAEYLGTDHHEIVPTPEDLEEALDEAVTVIEHFDPALVRSAVPNLLLAREAVKHVKVVLTGEGADELFAGYSYVHDDPAFATPDALQAELVRSIETLHELNLQRCDRTTMNYGLEARVPFLDATVMEEMLAIPAEWKLKGEGRTEKQLLREAFQDMVLDDILWRGKEQFGDGSGAGDVLAKLVEKEKEKEGAQGAEPPVVENGWELRSDEEVAYYRTWHRSFAGVKPNATLGAFATA